MTQNFEHYFFRI